MPRENRRRPPDPAPAVAEGRPAAAQGGAVRPALALAAVMAVAAAVILWVVIGMGGR